MTSSYINGFKSLWYLLTHASISLTCQFVIKDYPSWTNHYISYSRFVQICAAFHPESGTSQEGDKYHQLRYDINRLNKAAKHTFTSGKEMSFNEGGIPSKSNYDPIRQCHNSTPDKYRIGLFILANASSGHNSLITLMSIRKKGMAEDLWNLPMTQKAVMNAIVSTGLFTDQNGFCELNMDNCYSAPELFVILKTKYKILACGTVRTNWRGWATHVMNLSKTVIRGESKRF